MLVILVGSVMHWLKTFSLQSFFHLRGQVYIIKVANLTPSLQVASKIERNLQKSHNWFLSVLTVQQPLYHFPNSTPHIPRHDKTFHQSLSLSWFEPMYVKSDQFTISVSVVLVPMMCSEREWICGRLSLYTSINNVKHI